jgi:hypothetical protein
MNYIDGITHINGPLNIITLSKGNAKITLIGDYHEPEENQTSCENGSIDLDKFIGKAINNSKLYDQQLDVFIETLPVLHVLHKQQSKNDYKNRYSDDVIDFLILEFNIDIKADSISKTSTRYPNVILHFIDIRNLIFPGMDDMFVALATVISKMKISIIANEKLLLEITTVVDDVNDLMKSTYDALYNFQEGMSINEMNKIEDDKIGISLLIHKIKNSYKNENAKHHLKNYIDTELKSKFNDFFDQYDKINKHIKILQESYTKENILHENGDHNMISGITYGVPYLKVDQLSSELSRMVYVFNYIWFVDITSKIMDIYFLRKYFNSNIETGLVYTGIEHTLFYLQFLVKNIGYKIDSVSLLNDINKEQLTKMLNKNYDKSFHKYLVPKKLKQCSNTKGFTLFD